MHKKEIYVNLSHKNPQSREKDPKQRTERTGIINMSPVSVKNVNGEISAEDTERKREVYFRQNPASSHNNNLYRHMNVKLNG